MIQTGMLIPLNHAIAVRDLNKANALLQKPTRHQTLAAKVFGDRIIDPIQIHRCLGLR